VLIDICELQRVDQRLEAVGHRHGRVWVDDENGAHFAALSRVAALTIFTHETRCELCCSSGHYPANAHLRVMGIVEMTICGCDQGFVFTRRHDITGLTRWDGRVSTCIAFRQLQAYRVGTFGVTSKELRPYKFQKGNKFVET